MPLTMPRLKSSTIRVTENWIEMCLTEDRLISPDEHVAYKPLATPMPVPGKRVPFKPKLMWLTRLPKISI